MYKNIDHREEILFPEPVPQVHHGLFIIFIQKCGEDEDQSPVNDIQGPGCMRAAGREVCIENFGDYSKVQQVHGV